VVEPFDPAIRFFWEGIWTVGRIEQRRRLFDCELVYLSEGAYFFIADDETIPMTQGMIIIIPPAFWHESRVVDCNRVFRHCLHFDWYPDKVSRKTPIQARENDFFDERMVFDAPRSLRACMPMVISSAAATPIIPIVEELFQRLRERDVIAQYLLWPVLRFAVEQCTDNQADTFFGRTAKPFTAAMSVKLHIEGHYGERIDYRDLGQLTGLSKSYLCTVFGRIFGCPPMEYLNDVRLFHARKLLVSFGDKSISEIAYQVGFNSANYFARSFHRRYGVSPTEFMAQSLNSSTNDDGSAAISRRRAEVHA
jgi:AraC-like DNA-binding protein